MNRFALSISLRALRLRHYVESLTVIEQYDPDWVGLKITDTGEEWVAANQTRVATLIEGAVVPATKGPSWAIDDDIPF